MVPFIYRPHFHCDENSTPINRQYTDSSATFPFIVVVSAQRIWQKTTHTFWINIWIFPNVNVCKTISPQIETVVHFTFHSRHTCKFAFCMNRAQSLGPNVRYHGGPTCRTVSYFEKCNALNWMACNFVENRSQFFCIKCFFLCSLCEWLFTVSIISWMQFYFVLISLYFYGLFKVVNMFLLIACIFSCSVQFFSNTAQKLCPLKNASASAQFGVCTHKINVCQSRRSRSVHLHLTFRLV